MMMKGLSRTYRQGIAFMMAMVLVAVHILTGAGTAYAEESGNNIPEVRYVLDPEDIYEAIGKIGEETEAVDYSELKNRYSGDLGSLENKVIYDLDLSGTLEGSDTPYETELHVYYRPEAEDHEAQVFVLFVNSTTQTLRFTVKIGENVTEPCVVMEMNIGTATDSDGDKATSSNTPSLPRAGVVSIKLADIKEKQPETGYRKEIEDLLAGVTIKDAAGNSVTDGKLYVGEQYDITLGFQEGGALGLQFDEGGTLTYQIPSIFKITPITGEPLYVMLDAQPVCIGTYSVDENGLLTIYLSEDGKQALKKAGDISLSFTMRGTAQRASGGSGGTVNFGGIGDDFRFEVTDQPCVSVEKTGHYTENSSGRSGKLEYTVTTKVEHGEVHDAKITDVLTPPQSKAFNLSDAENVEVTIKRGEGTTGETLSPADYKMSYVNADPNHPGNEAFEIELLGEYAVLKKGDEVSVTYAYGVKYVEGSTDTFWGNVLNTVTVTGTMPVKDPDQSGGTTDIHVNEQRSSSVEIYVSPDGRGVVWKDQDYTEATKTLHYTLYTVIPGGKWTPLYIQDSMVVEYNGERWYLQEFKWDDATGKPTGRVKNLEVRAVDVPVSDWIGWVNTGGDNIIKDLEEYKEEARKLEGFNYNIFELPDYTPSNIEQYIYMYGGMRLNIIFGLDLDERWTAEGWEHWGSWNYDNGRLIITEYDLDMSGDDKLKLINENELFEKDPKTLELSPDEILKAGIRNGVNLRYSGNYPGYTVFFNNNEKINKTGKLDKETNTIEYTVTINITDSTVRGYFTGMKDEWSGLGDLYGWDRQAMYEHSMKAVLRDELPEGWNYVEGSLYATATNIWADESPHLGYHEMLGNTVTEEGGKKVINAPLGFFYKERPIQEGGNILLTDTFGDQTEKISFTYKVKADAEWIKDHATADEAVKVHNHAEIKDENTTHWSAENYVEYYPAKLTKKHTQNKDGSLHFKLALNPEAANFSPGDTLTVVDESTNLAVLKDSIKVTETATGEVENKFTVEGDFMLDGANKGGFKITVPDEKALTIEYDAIIIERGVSIPISNKASIEGVAGSDSGDEARINVSDYFAFGTGSTYKLTIEKVDEEETKNKLSGAEFECYIVLTEGAQLSSDVEFKINGGTYKAYKLKTLTTTQDGTVTFTDARLAPGNYYILQEITAPEGYVKSDEPILFYYGSQDSEVKDGVKIATDVLTVENERDLGDLTINKTIEIEYPEAFTETEKTLCFEIAAVDKTVTEEEYDEGKGLISSLNEEFETVDKDGNGKGTISFIGGKATVDLTVTKADGWTNSITIKDLPAGMYVVKELAKGGSVKNYVWTVDGGFGCYRVAKDTPAIAEIKNNYSPYKKTVPVKIRKNVSTDAGTPESKEFTFRISGTPLDGTVAVDETITVYSGSDKTINLKPGTYTITETGDTAIEGYTFEGLYVKKVKQENSSYEFKVDAPPSGESDGGETLVITIEADNHYIRDLGSLTIEKKVTIDAPKGASGTEAAIEGKSYKFTITGPEEANGVYNATKNGSATTVNFNDGVAAVELQAEEAITIKNLPTGDYIVDEENAGVEGYTWNAAGEGRVTVTTGGTASVTVINTYIPEEPEGPGLGSLTVTKVVNGGGTAAANKEYTFTITGPDGYRETVTITGSGSATIDNLAPGEYTVTEENAAIAGYTLTVSGGGTVTVEAGKNAEATITNTYTREQSEVGSLTVTKVVSGGGDEAAGKTYTFMVTGPNGYSTTVTVTGNGSTTLTELVPGTYTVTEDKENAAIKNYKLTVTGEGNVTVTAGGTASVTVTNMYTPEEPEGPGLGSLTVTKVVNGGGTAAANKEYTFTITGPDGYRETVTITGSGSTTLTELVPGAYTVTEENAAIDGYSWRATGGGNVTVAAGETVAVEVTNTYTTTEESGGPDEPDEPGEPDRSDEPTTTITPENPGNPGEPSSEEETSPANPTEPSPENPTNPTEPSPENVTEPSPENPSEPSPAEPLTPIDDEEVPLSDMPPVEIPDEAIPLNSTPQQEIFDEEVPLMAGIPKTGDEAHAALAGMLSLMALGMMGIFAAFRKKEDAE